jgi:hypothetical protein
MITRKPPFYNVFHKFENPFQFLLWRKEVNEKIKIPENISLNLKYFLEKCLQE